jgi:hypothetical protein
MDAHKRIHSRGELPTSRAGTRATLTSSTSSTGQMPSDTNSLHRLAGQAICNFWMNSPAARGASLERPAGAGSRASGQTGRRLCRRHSARESTATRRRRRSVIGIGAVWQRSDARAQWSISGELHSRGWLRGGSGELSISCWWLESAIAHRYYWDGFGLTRPIRSAFNSSQASPLPNSRRSRRERIRE